MFRYPLWVYCLPSIGETLASLVYLTVGFPAWVMWCIHGLTWGFVVWFWVAAFRQRRQMKELIKFMEAYHRLIAPPGDQAEGGRRIGGGD